MNHIVRITGRNGFVYEERMTQTQVKQFLLLAEARNRVGAAFDEWEVTILTAGEQTLTHQEQEETDLLTQANQKE